MNVFLSFFIILFQVFVPNSSLNQFLYDEAYDQITFTPLQSQYIEIDENAELSLEDMLIIIEKSSMKDINPKLLRDGIIEAIVDSLDDKYASVEHSSDFMDSMEGNYKGFGFDLDTIGEIPKGQFVISNVLENSAASEVGLKVGDIIESINEVKIFANNILYEGALALGEDGKNNFRIIRDGKPINIEIKSKPYAEPSISFKTLNNDIYYLRINSFTEDLPDLFKYHLKQVKQFKFDKVIIDLRFNPGGWKNSAIECISMLTDSDIVAYEKTKNDIIEIYRAETEKIVDIEPVVLITNSTGSSAELFASQLKEYCDATIVGEKSYGKNRGQSVYEFDGKILKFTTFYIGANKNIDVNFTGIEPDIYVEQSYTQPYRDVILIKAMELLE